MPYFPLDHASQKAEQATGSSIVNSTESEIIIEN
jgi:hypothetical protein